MARLCSKKTAQSKATKVAKAKGDLSISEKLQGIPIITMLRETDVLFGRGNGIASLPGNRNFRNIVSKHKHKYFGAARREKGQVTEEVVNIVHNLKPLGRFLEKVAPGKFAEVSRKKALEKTCQALREKKIKDGQVESTDDGGKDCGSSTNTQQSKLACQRKHDGKKESSLKQDGGDFLSLGNKQEQTVQTRRRGLRRKKTKVATMMDFEDDTVTTASASPARKRQNKQKINTKKIGQNRDPQTTIVSSKGEMEGHKTVDQRTGTSSLFKLPRTDLFSNPMSSNGGINAGILPPPMDKMPLPLPRLVPQTTLRPKQYQPNMVWGTNGNAPCKSPRAASKDSAVIGSSSFPIQDNSTMTAVASCLYNGGCQDRSTASSAKQDSFPLLAQVPLSRGQTQDIDEMFSALPPHLTAFFSGIYSGNNLEATAVPKDPHVSPYRYKFPLCVGDNPSSPTRSAVPVQISNPFEDIVAKNPVFDHNDDMDDIIPTKAVNDSPRSPPTVMEFDFMESMDLESNSSFGLLGDDLDEDFFVEDFRQLMG